MINLWGYYKKQVSKNKYLDLATEISIQSFYIENYHQVEQYILNNSGTIDDAKDIFQESLLVLMNCVQDKDFEFTVSPKAYFHSTVKYKWLSHLRQTKNRNRINNFMEVHEDAHPLNPEEILILEQKEAETTKLLNMVNLLKDECKKVLSMFYAEQLPMSKISKLLGYTEDFVRVKKHRCITELKKLINSNL